MIGVIAMGTMISWALVFCVALVLDVAWALYARAVADGRVWLATLSSGATGLAGLYGVSSVVGSAELAVPWVLGLMAGTYITVSVFGEG